MIYTIMLCRSETLRELFDDPDAEMYIYQSDTDWQQLRNAVAAARIEVARADTRDLNGLREDLKIGRIEPSRDNYEVVAVFEGKPNIVAYPNVTLTESL